MLIKIPLKPLIIFGAAPLVVVVVPGVVNADVVVETVVDVTVGSRLTYSAIQS